MPFAFSFFSPDAYYKTLFRFGYDDFTRPKLIIRNVFCGKVISSAEISARRLHGFFI